MGLEIEICTTEQSKGGRRGRRGGVSLFSCLHVKREDEATGRECERRARPAVVLCASVSCVGTEMPLSDANEPSVTSFSLLQMSICLHRVDPAEKTSGQWRDC